MVTKLRQEILDSNAVKDEGNTTNAMQSYWIRQAQHKHASNPETLKRGEKKKTKDRRKKREKEQKKKAKSKKKGETKTPKNITKSKRRPNRGRQNTSSLRHLTYGGTQKALELVQTSYKVPSPGVVDITSRGRRMFTL